MATLKYSEVGQSCHDIHEGSVCEEGREARGKERGRGEDKEGGARRRGRRHTILLNKGLCRIYYTRTTSQAHLQLLPTAGMHAATGYTLHMNTASVTYTLKGALIDLPNWKVAWLGHTW